MENIILSVKVVFPLIFMMAAGYILKKTNVVDEHSLNVMNKLTFVLFMPTLLFLNIYKTDISEILNKENFDLILMIYITIIAVFIISLLVIPKLVKDNKKRSVIIQGLVRGNSILFGIPIVAAVYGDENVGLISFLAACIIPLFNILGVIILELYRGKNVSISKFLTSICRNPNIIASVVSFVFMLTGIQISDIILSPLESISKVTTPLAFIVLGATLDFNAFNKNLKYLIGTALGKLVVIPAVVFYIAYFYGFRDEIMLVLLGIIASPVPIASFTMAREMEADGELAGQIVIFTSAASMFTIFIWIYLFKELCII